MRRNLLFLPMLAALAACGASGESANNQSAADTIDAEPANAVAGNAAAATGALSAYVGRLPSDAVDGTTFLANPLVRAAVDAAVADADVRRWVLREDVTSNPIGMRDGRIVATGCESHNCGAHNWSILIDPAGTSAEVCYARDTQGDRGMWYAAGRPAEQRPGACPSSS